MPLQVTASAAWCFRASTRAPFSVVVVSGIEQVRHWNQAEIDDGGAGGAGTLPNSAPGGQTNVAVAVTAHIPDGEGVSAPAEVTNRSRLRVVLVASATPTSVGLVTCEGTARPAFRFLERIGTEELRRRGPWKAERHR